MSDNNPPARSPETPLLPAQEVWLRVYLAVLTGRPAGDPFAPQFAKHAADHAAEAFASKFGIGAWVLPVMPGRSAE